MKAYAERECNLIRDNSKIMYYVVTPSPLPGLSFWGGRFSPEESRGTKSESLFHTLCYHNQMYRVNAGKD